MTSAATMSAPVHQTGSRVQVTAPHGVGPLTRLLGANKRRYRRSHGEIIDVHLTSTRDWLYTVALEGGDMSSFYEFELRSAPASIAA